MLKSALIATVLGFTLVAPAYAADYKCDENTLTTMKTRVDAMTDKEKQKTTIAMWEEAMADMKANKMDDCVKKIKMMDEQKN